MREKPRHVKLEAIEMEGKGWKDVKDEDELHRTYRVHLNRMKEVGRCVWYSIRRRK